VRWPRDELVRKFSQVGTTESQLDWIRQQLEPRVYNLNPHPLSIAIAATLFHMYSR
jgi:hypothetical protein